jgi:hypothetical protein
MEHICEKCNSLDVYITEKNEKICLTCLNIYSTDDLNEIASKGITIPEFPEELERTNNRHLTRTRSNSSVNFIRKVI